jgi:hypothetical protein
MTTVDRSQQHVYEMTLKSLEDTIDRLSLTTKNEIFDLKTEIEIAIYKIQICGMLFACVAILIAVLTFWH